jgi:hypothetical protein
MVFRMQMAGRIRQRNDRYHLEVGGDNHLHRAYRASGGLLSRKTVGIVIWAGFFQLSGQARLTQSSDETCGPMDV